MSLRIGVIGAGVWARRAHLPAFRHAPGAEIYAIADPDRARATLLARQFSIPHVFTNHRELLMEGVDAVSIAAPEDMHYELASTVIQAGLPVLCEKPLARTVDEAVELTHLAEAAGVVTKIGFVLRYSAALRHLYDLVRAGYVGSVHSFLIYSNNGQFMDPAAPHHWTMERARTGGGVFVEYGCHSLDLGRWLVGELLEVSANARTVIPARVDPETALLRPVDVEDVCSWLASFEGGAEGVFHLSWASLPQPWGDLAVFGNQGALVWRRTDDVWPFAEIFGATSSDPAFRRLPVPENLSAGLEWATTWRECFMGALARRFVDEVRGLVPVEGPTFTDGARIQVALAAIAASLQQRRWVKVPLGLPDVVSVERSDQVDGPSSLHAPPKPTS